MQTTLLVPGNYQGERRIKQNQTFDCAGKHRIKLPTVGVRTTGTVLVEMVDKNGLYFSDDFSLTFHMHYYKLLKWLLVLPMLAMFGVLVILRPQEAMPLPSFSRNTDLWWLYGITPGHIYTKVHKARMVIFTFHPEQEKKNTLKRLCYFGEVFDYRDSISHPSDRKELLSGTGWIKSFQNSELKLYYS